jgi:hypothetical protein
MACKAQLSSNEDAAVNSNGIVGTAVRAAGIFWMTRLFALTVVLSMSGLTSAFAAPPPGADEPLGFDLGELALRFSRKIQPPYRGLDPREAKQYLRVHIPPIEPIGGWDRADQRATRTDLIVLICKRLRLPIPEGQEGDGAAFWQALQDFANTQSEEAVHAIIGLFKEIIMEIEPTNFLTERERPGDPLPKQPRTPI